MDRARRSGFLTCASPDAAALLAERLGGGGEHLRDAKRFGQVAGNAEIHRFDRARFGGVASDDEDRQIEMEYARGRGYLHDLAEVTGGTMYDAGRLESLGDAFAKIAQELRSK